MTPTSTSASFSLSPLIQRIRQELIPATKINSVVAHNPVEVQAVPAPWQLLGTGNYAAVFCHPEYSQQVVKIYAPNLPGFEEEAEVYRRLGSHPAFSECLYVGEDFLVLKRLDGTTLYDCVHRGIPIPQTVIEDIDQALEYVRSRGLNPCDVHGRNVMMQEGRGLVVDVSDFLHPKTCRKWLHLKRAYYWFYIPLIKPWYLRVPYWLLDGVRRGYRRFHLLLSQVRRMVR